MGSGKRASVRKRLGLGETEATPSGYSKDFVLKVVQPGLAGLMDGSVSTLAPLFATNDAHVAFVVGLAAAIGAGISMAFSEGLSDTGELTG